MKTSRWTGKSNPHLPIVDYEPALEARTNLTPIKGRKVLVLLDEQNLSITARNLGLQLQYDQLCQQIKRHASTAELHLFTAAEPEDVVRMENHFRSFGYKPHLKNIRRRSLPDGRRIYDSNVDNIFSFWAGLHARRTSSEVIILGSGDYGLAGELAEAIHNRLRRKKLDIMTLSLPGSTSQALNASTNNHIEANLEVGRDLLSRPKQRVCLTAARARSRFYTFRSNRFVNRVS